MRSIFIIFLIGFLTTSFSQVEKIKANQFHSIKIYGSFKVTLIKSETSRAEIDYRGLNPEDVLIKSDDEELQIKIRNRSFFDFNDDHRNRGKRYAQVTIYYTTLDNIDAKAGAVIRSEMTIDAKSFSIISKMGSDVKLDLNVKSLEVDSSMGSEVTLTGKTETLEIKSKMGSNVNASMLQSQDVTVTSSMGSDVSVFAENNLNASADFGASISYKGNPAHKNTSKFLGAEVIQRKK